MHGATNSLRKIRIGRSATSLHICHSAFPVLELVAPNLVAKLVKQMVFAPPRITSSDDDQSPIKRGSQVEFRVDKKKVVAYVLGEGRPVLLVHGWGGNAEHMGVLAEQIAAAGFKAVVIDMPGHGASQGSQSSITHFAKTMQVSANIFGPYFGLVAHSFGAAAATYAMSCNLSVDCAVFLAPAVRFETYLAFMRGRLQVADQTWQRAMDNAEGWLNIRFDSVAPLALAADRKDTPLLIIHDPRDRECSFADSIDLAYLWPNAILRPVDKLGHRRILKDGGCASQAAAFLEMKEEELHIDVPHVRVPRIFSPH
jgi:pimeloyl-ACP methyl ester carboxylesterase